MEATNFVGDIQTFATAHHGRMSDIRFVGRRNVDALACQHSSICFVKAMAAMMIRQKLNEPGEGNSSKINKYPPASNMSVPILSTSHQGLVYVFWSATRPNYPVCGGTCWRWKRSYRDGGRDEWRLIGGRERGRNKGRLVGGKEAHGREGKKRGRQAHERGEWEARWRVEWRKGEREGWRDG